jgi:hypothetical protein
MIKYNTTINVPVVYMILMRANPLQGPLEGVSPNNRDFLGPEMGTSEASAKWAPAVPSIFVQNNLEINSDV